jgi:hypothetical protein
MTLPIIMVGGHPEDWGIIPTFLDPEDLRSAKEQFHAHYIGGWNKFEGFKWDADNELLNYGEGEDADPPMKPISMLLFREEMIVMFPYSWVMIIQPDGDWEIARMD